MEIIMGFFRQIRGAIFFGLALFSVTACQAVGEHASQVRDAKAEGERVSVGTVQREIKVGMSSAEVVDVLGAPNMVTTDSKRRENWVYDKISTEKVYSTSDGGASILILGAVGSTGAVSTSQKTLTIIIKYDEEGKVRDFAYRYSSF
jgi:outer membrane protein assembly factor BamE (lipoprotein component of BamABCDE complex)